MTPMTPPNQTPGEMVSDAMRVTTLDGKYTVILTAAGWLKAERHGQPWRDCVGDGLILVLAQDVETLTERLAASEAALGEAKEQLAKAGVGPYKGDYYLGRVTETGAMRYQISNLQERVNQAENELAELRSSHAAASARVAELEGALRRLEKIATRTARIGANTGPHWVDLAGATIFARSVLNRLSPSTNGRET